MSREISCGLYYHGPFMQPVRILFLASNPTATTHRSLDEEARAIEAKIRSAEHRDAFELITTWAVQPDDLLDAFMRHEPQVVHFSGHGNDRGEIVLTGKDGQPHPVSTQALAGLFGVLGQGVRTVVLNIGGSLPQARAIAEHVDCVVGMRQAISEPAVVHFAAAFYRALAFGRSVANAFGQGKLSLLFENAGESEAPELVRGPGVDPETVVLIRDEDDPPPPPPPSSPRPPSPPPPEGDGRGKPSSDTLPLWITTAPSREAALQSLLVEVFDGDPGGLLAWVRLALGPEIFNELSSTKPLKQLAFDVMLAARRHGYLNEAMFHSLRQIRPSLAGPIDLVARRFGIDLWSPR
jgi:hypothetical protein